MLGSKISFFGTHNGKNLWETKALPFNHPSTGEQVDTVYTADGSMIVSPEKAADMRGEVIEAMKNTSFKSGDRVDVLSVVVPKEV